MYSYLEPDWDVRMPGRLIIWCPRQLPSWLTLNLVLFFSTVSQRNCTNLWIWKDQNCNMLSHKRFSHTYDTWKTKHNNILITACTSCIIKYISIWLKLLNQLILNSQILYLPDYKTRFILIKNRGHHILFPSQTLLQIS